VIYFDDFMEAKKRAILKFVAAYISKGRALVYCQLHAPQTLRAAPLPQLHCDHPADDAADGRKRHQKSTAPPYTRPVSAEEGAHIVTSTLFSRGKNFILNCTIYSIRNSFISHKNVKEY